MTPLRVIYDGPGLSGRSTSLASAMSRAGVPTSSFAVGTAHETEFELVVDGHRTDLTARITIVRGQIWHDDPMAPNLHPGIVEEIGLLARADGIVFVIDTLEQRMEASLEAFETLERDLRSRGVRLTDMPVVFQANKRDAATTGTMDWVREHFRTSQCVYVESSSNRGIGTLEALQALVRLMRNSSTRTYRA